MCSTGDSTETNRGRPETPWKHHIQSTWCIAPNKKMPWARAGLGLCLLWILTGLRNTKFRILHCINNVLSTYFKTWLEKKKKRVCDLQAPKSKWWARLCNQELRSRHSTQACRKSVPHPNGSGSSVVLSWNNSIWDIFLQVIAFSKFLSELPL